MSTHNIGFYEDLTKIIFELSSNTHLISSAGIFWRIFNINSNKLLNAISHPYHLDEPTFIFFVFISFFYENHVSKQNSPRWDTVFAASHLGPFCLPMSHKKDTMLIWVKDCCGSKEAWSFRFPSSIT